MRKCLLAAVAILLSTSAFAATPQPALAEPSISADGKTIAFVSGGDIWTVPSQGGDARLLVANPANESRPLFSPDGHALAFTSTRSGNGDIYVLDLASGDTRRLTWDDAGERIDSWSPDGKWIYFSSNSGEADSGAPDVWRISSSGGTPTAVTNERVTYEYFAAPSPDGKTIAFVARGFASGQWWRRGHSHMDESQIYTLDSAGKYRAITADGAKELWPMWSADGSRIYYVSDRSGSDNIWWTAPGGTPQKVTSFASGRVIWPAIARDGSAIVFERDFGIWKLDLASGRAAAVPVTLVGSASAAPVEHRRLTDTFSDLAVSPDGKKAAFAVRGELFASATKDPGDAARITNTTAVEQQPVWTPDSKSIVYTADRGGIAHLYRYDFATEKETQLTSGSESDDSARFSPDGKLLAFIRNHRDLMLLDPATKEERKIAGGYLDRPPFFGDQTYDFSPDGKWIAYLSYGPNMFRNVQIVPVAGGTSKPATFLANVFTDSLFWSGDGKYLVLLTGQRTEPSQIVRVDVVPQTPKLREEQFRELFKETPKPAAETKSDEAKPAEKPATAKKPPVVEVEFSGIRDRIQVIPVGMDADALSLSPDGKWLAFLASVGDAQNVYIYSIDELATDPAIAKQLSATPGRKSSLQWSSDSKEVWYLDGGKIAAATVDPVKTRSLSVGAEMDVDFGREKEEAFQQAWTYLRDAFFDPKMNGVDWTAERETYAPRVAAAKNGDEFRRLLSLMVGDLNASHLGASAPGSRPSTGRLGVFFSPDEYDAKGLLKISEVVPLSPADVAKVRAGEYLVAIDGTPITRSTNVDSLLDYKIGKRTVVTVASSADGSGRRDVVLKPVNWAEQRALVYRDWVNRNRDYVARASGGRLGYVHMYDMGSASLEKLYVDLDAENRMHDGVVIDLRNNHGGFVNAYALDVFARRPYLTMTARDMPPSAARSVLGQRSLEKPTILVINRHSLSDAEDFTEGYRTMKLGEVVGEPTAGWIIYTGGTQLVDGTILRLPSTRITDSRGQDMEMHPRPVDKFVKREIGESREGKDSQLDAAVAALLAALK